MDIPSMRIERGVFGEGGPGSNNIVCEERRLLLDFNVIKHGNVHEACANSPSSRRFADVQSAVQLMSTGGIVTLIKPRSRRVCAWQTTDDRYRAG